MFRLSYLIPRMILLAVFALLLCLCVNPLVHYQLVQVGRMTTGANIEIGDVRTSVRDHSVRVQDVQIADPLSPWNNLLEFAEGQFRFDRNALWNRRFVVDDGFISGVRIGGQRIASGALQSDPLQGEAASGAASLQDVSLADSTEASLGGGQWLDLITGRYDDRLEGQLESYQTAQQLTQQWPESYRQLSRKAELLRARLLEIQAAAKAEGENPLRYVPAYKSAYRELSQLRLEIREYYDEIEAMREKTGEDRREIEAARERDLTRLARAFNVEQLDGDQVSEHLLRDEMVARVQKWLTYVRDGRHLLQRMGEAPRFELVSGRGKHLLTPSDRPDYLIRRLAFDGQGVFDHQPFHFLGVAENVTNQPRLHRQPTTIRVSAAAPTPMEVEVTLNHGKEDEADHLRVSCPALPTNQRLLGDPGSLALNVAPGTAEVWMNLEILGDQIQGELRVKQTDAVITPHVADAEQRQLENMRLAVREIRGLQGVCTLSGTLQKPSLEIRSNIGPQLTHGLSLAMAREIELRREKLIEKTQTLVKQEMQLFDTAVADARESVLLHLAESEKAVAQFQEELASRLGDAFYIFETGPQFDNLLRR